MAHTVCVRIYGFCLGRGNGGNVRLPADTLVALPEEAGLPAADTSLPKCDVRAEVSRDTLLKYDAIMDSAMRRANVPFMDSMLRVIRYGDVDTLSMACPIEARVYDWLPEPTRPPLVKIGKTFPPRTEKRTQGYSLRRPLYAVGYFLHRDIQRRRVRERQGRRGGTYFEDVALRCTKQDKGADNRYSGQYGQFVPYDARQFLRIGP